MSFSTQEKRALAGIGLIAAFIAFSIYEIGERNFWFEAKNTYKTHLNDADGLRVGSVVTIAGLRVGEVSHLEVDEQNRIAIDLTVRRTVASRIRSDSVAAASRAFIIGEKRIDLIPGTGRAEQLPDGATLPGKDLADLAEFLSGRKLAELMDEIQSLISGVNGALKEMDDLLGKYHAGTFDQTFATINAAVKELNELLVRYRTGDYDKTFAMIDPALRNFLKLSDDLIVMTKEMKTQSKQLPIVVDAGAQVLAGVRDDFFTNHLAKDSVVKLNKVLTPLADRQKLLVSLLGNLEDLSRDLKNDPQFGKDVLEAVNELTITLKSLQRTWILDDQADQVKAEEAKAKAKAKKAQKKKAPQAAPQNVLLAGELEAHAHQRRIDGVFEDHADQLARGHLRMGDLEAAGGHLGLQVRRKPFAIRQKMGFPVRPGDVHKQLWIGPQQADHADGPRTRGHVDQRRQIADQHLPRRKAGARGHRRRAWMHLIYVVFQHLPVEQVLVLEVVVNGHLRDFRLGCDPVHAGAVESTVDKFIERSGKNAAMLGFPCARLSPGFYDPSCVSSHHGHSTCRESRHTYDRPSAIHTKL